MAWTQTDLDAIEAAIKNGHDEVRYENKSVKYKSLDDMLKIRDLIKKELGQVTGASNRVYASHSKGLVPREE